MKTSLRRPKVNPNNYEATYAYYAQHRQNRCIAQATHRLVGLSVNTHLSFDPGVEDTIAAELEAGRQLVVAAHHVSLKDPPAVAQIPVQSEACAPLLGTTFVAAKSGLFKYPVLRHAVDNLGAVPTFRAKDMVGKDMSTEKARRIASGLLINTAIAKINAGENMAWFPGGERAKETPETVPKLQVGIGKIVCGVTEVPQPRIIPVGIQYRDASTPYLHLGTLSEAEFGNPQEVMDWLHPSLQAGVNQASERIKTFPHAA